VNFYINNYEIWELFMQNIKGNTLSIVMILTICACLPINTYAAGKDETLRKLLGIGGICLAINGLYKVATFHPIKGISRIIAGAVVGVGGICSDIIMQRGRDLYEQSRREDQNQDLCQDLVAGAKQIRRTWSSAFSNIKDSSLSRYQLSYGKDSLLSGNILTGLDQVYDGIYKGVRTECFKILADE
jgi:hypothetical protein